MGEHIEEGEKTNGEGTHNIQAQKEQKEKGGMGRLLSLKQRKKQQH